MKEIIKINHLSVRYQQVLALDNISATIYQGEMLAIVGANGAGKSTLLKSLLAEQLPYAGSIDFVTHQSKSIAYLPQSHLIDADFPISVKEFIFAGNWRKSGLWQRLTGQQNSTLTHCLQQVGLEDLQHKQISCLSGGQFQRMLFARMLMQDADILLLDEPFNNIDQQTTIDLIQILLQCQQQGKTVIAVIHDLNLVKQYFPSVMLLATSLIAKGISSTVLNNHNLIKAGFHFLPPDEGC